MLIIMAPFTFMIYGIFDIIILCFNILVDLVRIVHIVRIVIASTPCSRAVIRGTRRSATLMARCATKRGAPPRRYDCADAVAHMLSPCRELRTKPLSLGEKLKLLGKV